MRRIEPVIEPAAQHSLYDARLLVDLLVHEMRVSVSVVAGGIGLDKSWLLGSPPCVQRRCAEAVGTQRSDLTVVKVDDLAGVTDQRRYVRRGVHLLVANAE